MDVLDEGVKSILWKLCENKKADEFVFVNPKTKKPYTDVRELAGYEAFTIKALMGHREIKTTERPQ